MKRRLALQVALFALGGAAQGPATAGAPVLRHDPFERPDLAAVASGAAPHSEGAASAAAAAAWKPRLRAVVVAGARSSVMVDDRVVELGGEVEGYRLIRVLPDRALFVRDGHRVEITMGAARAP